MVWGKFVREAYWAEVPIALPNPILNNILSIDLRSCVRYYTKDSVHASDDQRTEFNSWMGWPWFGLAWAAIAGFGISAAQAQMGGYRLTDTEIIVDTQEHWARWSRPEHVLDLVDGQVRPHFFRHVYSILAEDLASFRRPIEKPTIRKADRTILTVGRTPVLTREGELKLEEQKIGRYLDADFGRFPGNATRDDRCLPPL